MRAIARMAAALLAMAMTGCGAGTDPQKGIVFAEPAEGLEFHLVKVVSGFYTTSEDFYVYCRSARHHPLPSVRSLPNVPQLVAHIEGRRLSSRRHQGSDEEALRVARAALREGNGFLAWHLDQLRATPDRCASWLDFDPARHLEPRLVASPSGLPCDTGECVAATLRRARWSAEEIAIEPAEDLSRSAMHFVLRSPALLHPSGLELASSDGGLTWRATIREAQAADAPAFQPDPERYVRDAAKPRRGR